MKIQTRHIVRGADQHFETLKRKINITYKLKRRYKLQLVYIFSMRTNKTGLFKTIRRPNLEVRYGPINKGGLVFLWAHTAIKAHWETNRGLEFWEFEAGDGESRDWESRLGVAALIAVFIAVAVYSKTTTSGHCAKVNSPYFSVCLCVFFSSFIIFSLFGYWEKHL